MTEIRRDERNAHPPFSFPRGRRVGSFCLHFARVVAAIGVFSPRILSDALVMEESEADADPKRHRKSQDHRGVDQSWLGHFGGLAVPSFD